MNKKHIMLDLETLGRKSGCTILSIGAVEFDPYGTHIGLPFYRNIYRPSCAALGLTEEPETVEWWEKQSQEAKDHLKHEQVFIREAIVDFIAWLGQSGNTRIWCQGATFDAPILEHAINALGFVTPWQFWNVRDTRTVYDLTEFDYQRVERLGTHHNAAADAVHQCRCIQVALNPPSFLQGVWNEIKTILKGN